LSLSGRTVTRKDLGLPEDWSTIQNWLNPDRKFSNPPALPKEPLRKKCPEIPTLQNYESPPPEEFWEKFPKRPLPAKPTTRVNLPMLKARINRAAAGWTIHQKVKARKAIETLSKGGKSFQKSVLPDITVPNAKSAFKHGELITDSIANFVKKGIIAGPFDSPPTKRFRSNSIMAVEQKDKVRLVLDMSRPAGRSFNDNVDKSKLDKVYMDTAKTFSYRLKDAGVGATMAKQDTQDAYKLVPAEEEDWGNQGMTWLGKRFVETQETFGAIVSVPNYDGPSGVFVDITKSESKVPSKWIGKTLDDLTFVSPAGSGLTKRFSDCYRQLCKDLNVPLAEPCPDREKAFEEATSGKVLGIWFDSITMTWTYPENKLVPLIRSIHNILAAPMASLKQMQKVWGGINDVAQLCPFLKAFRKPSNSFVSQFNGNEEILLPTPAQVKLDLATCAKVIITAGKGLPIVARPADPAPNSITFTSDAAGASFKKVGGRKVVVKNGQPRGVASVSFSEDGQLTFSSRLMWPESFITEARDEDGCLYGSKSTTLEAIGLLLPFIADPARLAGRNIILKAGLKTGLKNFKPVNLSSDM